MTRVDGCVIALPRSNEQQFIEQTMQLGSAGDAGRSGGVLLNGVEWRRDSEQVQAGGAFRQERFVGRS
jgi:hypothetical protein